MRQPSQPQPRTSGASRRLAKFPPPRLSTETLQSTSSLASPHLLPTPTRHQSAQGIAPPSAPPSTPSKAISRRPRTEFRGSGAANSKQEASNQTKLLHLP